MRILTKVIFLIFLCFTAVQTEAQSVGGSTSGAASYSSATNSGFVSLTGYTGGITGWESSTDGGFSWTPIPNVTPSQSYFNLSQTTCYRAIVQNCAFPPDTSTVSCITVCQPSDGGTITGGGVFCGSSGTGTLLM